MNEWMVSSDAMERVRSGVMGRVRRRRMVRRGLVAAAVLIMAFWPRPVEMESLVLRMPVPPAAPAWAEVAGPTAPMKLARAGSAPAERITIYTDDPNVVIVLVGDGGGE